MPRSPGGDCASALARKPETLARLRSDFGDSEIADKILDKILCEPGYSNFERYSE
jgi:hypothetical protein